jgi:hypothetical protein
VLLRLCLQRCGEREHREGSGVTKHGPVSVRSTEMDSPARRTV